ncbi:MAG: pilus assembly protein [Sulfuricella sp.]|nr:pilus assembly protein [Sulfuricella sp.]
MKNALNRLSAQRQTGEKGAAAVEFALVVIVLLLIVAGIVEFGRAFWYYDALTKATRDGARYMSTANVATINTAGVPAARTLVVTVANAARVSPVLGSGNVSVTCLDTSYGVVPCQNNTAPANVRVAIVNYSITLGGLLPLAYTTGQAASGATLTPSTTMRYMN